jgi:hypothetical protein
MNNKTTKSINNRRMKRKALLVFIFIIFISIFGKDIWGVVGINIPYSRGERSVMIIKFSNKGMIWKTWEGEAVLSQKGFAVTYVWPFSIDENDVNKEEIINQVNEAFEKGVEVKIRYDQMAGTVP